MKNITDKVKEIAVAILKFTDSYVDDVQDLEGIEDIDIILIRTASLKLAYDICRKTAENLGFEMEVDISYKDEK